MPSISSSALPIPLANPKQEIPEEAVELLENQEEGDALSQLLENAPKQEHEQQEFDDSNFENTLDDTGKGFTFDPDSGIPCFIFPGDGTQENDFDMSAGPSNPDESTDQVPQGKLNSLGFFSSESNLLLIENFLKMYYSINGMLVS